MANVYATWDAAVLPANLLLSNANKTVTNNAGKTGSSAAKGTIAKNSGKALFELTYNGTTTQITRGLITPEASVLGGAIPPGQYLGILGVNPQLSTGVSWQAGTYVNDTNPMLFAVDFTAKKCWVGQGNAWFAGGDPVAGTTPSFYWTADLALMPVAYLGQYTSNLTTLNAGESAFGNATLVSTLVAAGYDAGWFTGDAKLAAIFNTRRDL